MYAFFAFFFYDYTTAADIWSNSNFFLFNLDFSLFSSFYKQFNDRNKRTKWLEIFLFVQMQNDRKVAMQNMGPVWCISYWNLFSLNNVNILDSITLIELYYGHWYYHFFYFASSHFHYIFFRVTEISFAYLVETDWGCRMAEFCAWQVKFLLWCSVIATNFNVEMVTCRFPSFITSVRVRTPSSITRLSSVNHVIYDKKQ